MTRIEERCSLCGGRASQVRDRVNFAIGRRSVPVEVELFRCSDCGEVFYTPQQMQAAQRSASDEVRRQDGLLSPSEIRAIRVQCGLTQSEFERLLGVGPKTDVRWEKGTVFQNKSTDTLLRILREVPEAVSFLADLRQVKCARPEKGTAPPWRDSRLVSFDVSSSPKVRQRRRRSAHPVQRVSDFYEYKARRTSEETLITLEEATEQAPVVPEEAFV